MFPFEVIPVFTSKEYAEAALDKINGSRVLELGKDGFINFLKKVVIPRRIECVVFNPDVKTDDEVLIEIIPISSLIANLESDMTDQEIERLIKNDDLKLI